MQVMGALPWDRVSEPGPHRVMGEPGHHAPRSTTVSGSVVADCVAATDAVVCPQRHLLVLTRLCALGRGPYPCTLHGNIIREPCKL